MRVGIIGCGKVADSHASQILRIRDAEIVAVCDQEELMAQQLAERMGVRRHYSDARTMLTAERIDIIHITTSPQSHYPLAKQCLEAGCHVYVEKPFTVNSQEARDLIALAEGSGKKITVGHNYQFTPVARDMHRLIQAGYLGGAPVHMDSVYCYEFSDERYAKALLGDRNHWVRKLPGGLLQNIISHGIGKIVEYMPDEKITVVAHGFTSGFLKGLGETDIADELRVMIHGNRGTTAYFTFSSQMSPSLHQFRVYGPKGSLAADYLHETLTKLPENLKSYLNQIIPPFSNGKQSISHGCLNVRRFFRKELHSLSGMYNLITRFYRSVTENAPVPIPYWDIIRTSLIMDCIFNQLKSGSSIATIE
jgi:predicted dehydrogenase